MLEISQQQQIEIEQAAIAAYPRECCGILLGKTLSSGSARLKQVTQVWPTKNSWTPEIEVEFRESLGLPIAKSSMRKSDIRESNISDPDISDPEDHHSKEHSQGDRFWIDPRELLQAQKFARSQHWNIVGIYHSHPDHPAVPSERDRLSAWSDYSYVILSVQSGGIADCQSWILNEANQFEAEAVAML